MADIPYIRHCYPVTGDWFLVNRNADNPNGEDRWFIERVVLWAVVEVKEHISHVRAINSIGHPHLDEGDTFFVHGADMSPAGVTWKELYDQTQPTLMQIREITGHMEK